MVVKTFGSLLSALSGAPPKGSLPLTDEAHVVSLPSGALLSMLESAKLAHTALLLALMFNANFRATAAVAPLGALLSSFHQNSPLLCPVDGGCNRGPLTQASKST